MTTVVRHDRAAAPRRALGEYVGTAARTHVPGDPLAYVNSDGSTRLEYRTRDELAGAVRRMVGIPVRLGHGGATVGSVTRAELDGDRAVVSLQLDAAGRAAVDDGTIELSLGYETNVVAGYQTNIRPHELAIVPSGRCGPACSITKRDACGCGGACTPKSPTIPAWRDWTAPLPSQSLKGPR